MSGVTTVETHDDDAVVWPADLKKTYNTDEVAAFFGRQRTWVYWGLDYQKRGNAAFAPPWRRSDGTEIRPTRVGGRREMYFTLDDIREIVMARYRRHDADEAETQRRLEIIKLVEQGRAELLSPELLKSVDTGLWRAAKPETE